MTATEDQIEGHRARNEQLLSDLSTRGVSLRSRRQVDHYFLLPGQEQAGDLASELFRMDFKIMMLAPIESEDGTTWWHVEGALKQSPEDAAAPSFVRKLVLLAEARQGVYDGWGTQI